MVLIINTAGCSKIISTDKVAGTPASEDYVDLKPGWTVLVVVPLLKSGGFQVNDLIQQGNGEALSFSSNDVIGYTVSHYTTRGKKDGAVRLHFEGAEITREGKTARESRPPALPLELPQGTAHIRLVYETRLTTADHNMAVVASHRLPALNAFTRQLEKDPTICSRNKEVFCSWVSTGVAVRPELQ